MAGSDKIRAIEVLAKMHRWNAQEKINVSGELKRGVTLNVTYTMESQPRKKIRLSYHSLGSSRTSTIASAKDPKRTSVTNVLRWVLSSRVAVDPLSVSPDSRRSC